MHHAIYRWDNLLRAAIKVWILAYSGLPRTWLELPLSESSHLEVLTANSWYLQQREVPRRCTFQERVRFWDVYAWWSQNSAPRLHSHNEKDSYSTRLRNVVWRLFHRCWPLGSLAYGPRAPSHPLVPNTFIDTWATRSQSQLEYCGPTDNGRQ